MTTTRLQQIQEMLKNEPNDSFLNYALAIEYAKTDDIKKAIQLIEALLIRDENYLGAYYQLGKYYEQTEQPQAAIVIYNKGIAIAQQQKNKKTEGELNEALLILGD
jgi:tetratricopeptide (TPR) repeat protein